jgi:hypothetical protein
MHRLSVSDVCIYTYQTSLCLSTHPTSFLLCFPSSNATRLPLSTVAFGFESRVHPVMSNLLQSSFYSSAWQLSFLSRSFDRQAYGWNSFAKPNLLVSILADVHSVPSIAYSRPHIHSFEGMSEGLYVAFDILSVQAGLTFSLQCDYPGILLCFRSSE